MTLESPSRFTLNIEDVDWARVVERLCFLFPPVIGVGFVGVLQDADPNVPGVRWGLVLFGAFGYTFLTVGLMVALFLDARRIRARSGAAGNWRPNPWLTVVFALLWAPAAGVVYLYRRHRRFGTPAGWPKWWLVIALSLVSTIVGLTTAVIAYVLAMPSLLATGIGFAGAVAFGLFPIAIHQDAAYLSTRRVPWNPNPGAYLGLAFLSLFVPVIQPVLATYYLLRRRRVMRRSVSAARS